MADLQVTFDTVSLNSQKQTNKVPAYESISYVFLQNSVIHIESPPNEKGKH